MTIEPGVFWGLWILAYFLGLCTRLIWRAFHP